MRRAYAFAGVRPKPGETASLARVYAAWAQGADTDVVARIERKLTRFLGCPG